LTVRCGNITVIARLRATILLPPTALPLIRDVTIRASMGQAELLVLSNKTNL